MKINLSEIKKTGAKYITLNHFSSYQQHKEFAKKWKFWVYDIKNKKWKWGDWKHNDYVEKVKNGYLWNKRLKVFFFENAGINKEKIRKEIWHFAKNNLTDYNFSRILDYLSVYPINFPVFIENDHIKESRFLKKS